MSRISQLDAAAPLTGAEQIALDQNSRTKQTTIKAIKDFTDTSCQCTLVSRGRSSSTGADTLETYFETWQMPDNTLSSNGDWLEIFAYGTTAANSNLKTLTLYFGGTSIYVKTIGVNNKGWEIRAKVLRTSSTTQKTYSVSDTMDAGNHQIKFPTEDLSSTISISISGTNGSASAGDINCEGFFIRLNKVDADS